MNVMELGAIGELVGGVAVIGTLVYLGAQVRQGTRTARSASYQAAVASVSDWSRCVGQDTGLAVLFHDGSRDPGLLTREQRIQYVYLVTSLVRNFQNIHYQFESGSLDQTNWSAWEVRIQGLFASPGVQAWWRGQRLAYTASFREFVEATPRSAVPLPHDPLESEEA